MIFFLLVLFAIGVVSPFWHYHGWGQDIFYTWRESNKLLHGIDPYARIISNTRLLYNHEYAIYTPAIYVLQSLLIFSFHTQGYIPWLADWRFVVLAFYFGIALLLFVTHWKKDSFLLAFFATFLWITNRWTLGVAYVAHIDFIAIFFLLLSLLALQQDRKRWSFALYGISLVFKQIGAVFLPIYLFEVWKIWKGKKKKEASILLSLLALAPALFCFPFLLWNPIGFIKSMIFPAVRAPRSLNSLRMGPALESYLHQQFPWMIGIVARLPLLILLAILYTWSFRRSIGIFSTCLLVYIAVLSLNSTLFNQYITWLIPFFTLAISEQYPRKQSKRTHKP